MLEDEIDVVVVGGSTSCRATLASMKYSAVPARIDTSLVRSFAIAAIVNSHMEIYYPRPEVAIGGLVGLALFFMATGMGISASRNTRTLSFPKWFGMRILRIHPSVVVSAVLIQILLFGAWRKWGWTDSIFSNPYVDNLVYPLSTYHFLNKIFVFYIPLYFYVRWNWKHKHTVGIAVCCLLCLATAVPDIRLQLRSDEPLRTGFLNEPFLWSIFFLMTLLGVWIADCPALFRPRPWWIKAVSVGVLAILYLGCKVRDGQAWCFHRSIFAAVRAWNRACDIARCRVDGQAVACGLLQRKFTRSLGDHRHWYDLT